MVQGVSGGVASNVQSTSFHGAAVHTAVTLGIPESLVRRGSEAIEDLTSPHPTGVRDLVSKAISGALNATTIGSQTIGIQNSGPAFSR